MVSGWWLMCLSVRLSCPSVFSLLDNHLSECQWIFNKLAVCIDIVEIWFGIANGQISSIFDRVICPGHVHIFVAPALARRCDIGVP